MKKNLAYYQGLPYELEVERFVDEEDGETYFCASYEELPHVKGIHRDRLAAIQLAKELFDAYIEAQLEWGNEIPEPAETRSKKRGPPFKFQTEEDSRSGGSSEASVKHTLKPTGKVDLPTDREPAHAG